MGKIRARTDAELTARKQEILDAAARQLMTADYDVITLATIAEETSISRTSMYTYYETKEAVFVDLLIQEYRRLEQKLRSEFCATLTRDAFCRNLSHILWEQPILLKLLSLQLSVWDHRYDDKLVKRFVEETLPYMRAMDDILELQFPNSDKTDRNRFKLQFSVYCNSLYAIEHLPASQIDAMNERSFFEEIPSGEIISYEGLMLLSADLK